MSPSRYAVGTDESPERHIRSRPRRPGLRALLGLPALACALLALAAVAVVHRARIDRSLLREPARIYGAPLVLRPGMEVSRAAVERHLQAVGYRPAGGGDLRPGEYRLGTRTWNLALRTFRLPDRVIPGGRLIVRLDGRGRIASLRDPERGSLPVTALEPILLRTVPGPRTADRVLVPLEEVPAHLVEAVLAVEDRRFFRHRGLDLRRIGGALAANLRAGRLVEGGSTLTQQLAKNLYLSPRRSLGRKVAEAFLALALEWRYPKERILEAYLNEVYLGQDGALGIHGVGRAALHYFGRDVGELAVPEAALLAGMIRGPNLYSPFRNPDAARRRRDLVVRLMSERGALTGEELREALGAPLGARPPPAPPPGSGYFTDHVVRSLEAARKGVLRRGGLAVLGTLDPRLQRAAETAVSDGLARLERRVPALRRSGAVEPPLQAALIALDPGSGEVLAMVGGRGYRASPFNRAVDARRQPGSLFKPVVALAALARSSREEPRFTLATPLLDEVLALRTPAGVWRPANHDGRFRGRVSVREALERSLNVPFARLGLEVGADGVVATARALGIESPLAPVPSLALGSSEVSLLEMVGAYGVLAAGGERAGPRAVRAVAGGEGAVPIPYRPDALPVSGGPVRAFDPAEAFLVTSALRGAVERGTARGLRALGYLGPVAGKTGSTNAFRDAWFVGYTPEIVAGVWVGFDDGRSLGLPGSAAALPIFADFLTAALGRYGGREFHPPEGVEIVEVDPATGLRAGPGCRGTPELFLAGTAPEESCSPWRLTGGWREMEEWLKALRRSLDRDPLVPGSEERRGLLREMEEMALRLQREVERRLGRELPGSYR